MSIKAIVWDLDGTLIHFKIDWLRARRETVKMLKKDGVPKDILSIQGSILENIRLARQFFESSSYKPKEIEDMMNEVDQVVTSIEYEAALDATAIEGIEMVLEFVKERNMSQAIYTFNTYRNAELSLEKAELSSYFKVIVGRDNVKNAKPHPEHLSTICSKLNVLPSEIIVIGDNHRDIEGALNVGAKSIAIKNNLSKLINLEILNKADFIIEDSNIPIKLIESIEKLL